MFVRKTECVLACKVRVCKFDAKTTHPELGFFLWNHTHRNTQDVSQWFGNSKRQGETEDNDDPSPS